MLKPLRKMFKPGKKETPFSVPEGTRYYAIGDIHGRLDLFDMMIAAIEEDDRAAAEAETTVVLLGDLVDRGPDSAGVVARARKWQKSRNVRIIAGNHEEMFLAAFKDLDKLRAFNKFGGRETILSYGVDHKKYRQASLEELQKLMKKAVPKEDREFIRSFDAYLTAGDYLFVHAGINPEVPLEEQRKQDMRWIRDRFLDYDGPHSHFVIHGHTIMEQVDTQKNRIGVDTGAYRTGRLSAIVLEGNRRRIIQAVDKKGKIEVLHLRA